MNNRLLIVAALTLTAYGCRCGPPTTGDNKPDYVANPVALNFEACPVKDEQGKPVADVFPDAKKVTITNQSKGTGGLKLSFTGDGAAAFTTDLKKATPADPTGLSGVGDKVEVPVYFSPTKKGVVKGQLVISDETDETADVKVDLNGTGSDLGSQPTLKVEVVNVAKQYETCLEGLVCTQNFDDTLFKESVTADIKITNLGCPSLKITKLDLQVAGGSPTAYYIDAPSVPPSESAPLVLSQATGTQSTILKVRFAPEDDGSGNLIRFATLRLTTNDPNVKDGDNKAGNFDILLSGSALEPAIYTTPTRCDYTDMTDLCGNTTKIADKAKFQVKNGGNVDVKIDGTTFGSNNSETSNAGGRLTITGTPLKGVVIPQGGSATLEVTHTEMPLYIQDLLTISASVITADGGTLPPGSAGRAVLSLSGGKKPCLSTDPPLDMLSGQTKLDFGAPTTELSVKELKIKNGPAATCGDLIIKSVVVDGPQPFFSLIDPMITAGTKIPPGQELTATVQYKKPISGGTQVGTLRINSNDGDYASPPGYVVQLYSQSPLDQLPVCILRGCLTTDTNCTMPKNSVSLGTLPLGPNNTRLFNISAAESYDPQPDGGVKKPLPSYRFGFIPPANAMDALLPGKDVRDAGSQLQVQLDGVATGLYRFTLDCWDDKDQKGGTQALLQLNVLQ